MECVTAHLSRLEALKIDGSKPAAETPDRGATLHDGRGAFRLSRSRAVKSGGSAGNVDPGGSNSKRGVRISSAERARVSRRRVVSRE